MSDESPAVTAGPPVSADTQDPLPESKWGWRRAFTIWTVVMAAAGVVGSFWLMYFLGSTVLDLIRSIAAVRDAKSLDNALATVSVVVVSSYKLGIACVVVWTIAQILYLVAPSAEQIAKMMQMASLLKIPGFSMGSSATASGPEGTATTTTTAGRPAPPLPPAPPPATPKPSGTEIIE